MVLKINKVRVLIIYITFLIYSNQSYSSIHNPQVFTINSFFSSYMLLPVSNLILTTIFIWKINDSKNKYDVLEKKYQKLDDDYRELSSKKKRLQKDVNDVSRTAESALTKAVQLEQDNVNLMQRNHELEVQLNDLSSRQESLVANDSVKNIILQFSAQAGLTYEDTENLIVKILEAECASGELEAKCASGEIDFNDQEIWNKINSEEFINPFKRAYDKILKHYVLDENGKPITDIYNTPVMRKYAFYRDQDQQKNRPTNSINVIWLYLTNHRECNPISPDIIGFQDPVTREYYNKNEEDRLLKAAGLTLESLKNIYAISETYYSSNKKFNCLTVVDDKSKIRRGIFYNFLEKDAKVFCRHTEIINTLPPRANSGDDEPMSLTTF